jgi:hypothetical protein
MLPTEGGKGQHHVYHIPSKDLSDCGKLTAGNHYVGVEAVAWFINKQSTWFSDKMASGTLDITLSGGLEKYQVALGTFELAGGATIAPVFEKPVLNDRNYRGGPITLSASLTAIKKDTAIAGMLKSAASASLGIVAGMVQTATLTGPVQLLSTAGTNLVSGVQKILGDTVPKREAIFSFYGLEYNLQPEYVVGPETFLLMHRGASLEETRLTIQASGTLLMPFYDGTILNDGAWLLLRIRRNDEYHGVRDWFEDSRKLRGRIKSLVDDVNSEFVTKEEALAQLKPSATGDKMVLDEFFRLRSIITNDGVLSEREAGLYVGQLYTAIIAARKAIDQANPKVFASIINDVYSKLSKGEALGGNLGEGFEEQVSSVAKARSPFLVRDTNLRRIASFSGNELYENMKYLPNALKESISY